MCALKYPFQTDTPAAALAAMAGLSEKVCNEPFEDIPAHYSKNLQALIDCMLKKEPEDFKESEDDPLLGEEEKREKRRLKISNRVIGKDDDKRTRMNACMTYFAIMNGYTTMSLFTLPIGFKYGGWIFSPIVLLVACFVETFAAVRLIQAARVAKIYSYTDLVEFQLGKTYKYFF